MSTKGSRSGKSSAMICLTFCLEIELNMFFYVYEQQHSSVEETPVLSASNVLFNTQPHCRDDEVHVTVHTECVVEGQQVFGETAAEQVQDHLCCDPPQG